MDITKPSANRQPNSDQYTAKNASILAKVLSLVSPSSNSLPFDKATNNPVPTGPSFAARFFQTFFSESCRSMFSMRVRVRRYSSESGGSNSSAFTHACLAPCQSRACPASCACCTSASNSCCWVSVIAGPTDRRFGWKNRESSWTGTVLLHRELRAQTGKRRRPRVSQSKKSKLPGCRSSDSDAPSQSASQMYRFERRFQSQDPERTAGRACSFHTALLSEK